MQCCSVLPLPSTPLSPHSPAIVAKLEIRCGCEIVASTRLARTGGMPEPATQCRGNGGGGGEGGAGGMRTVECLRGRLLAERVASKAAKEEADQLATRLDELEKKLSDEVKVRNKAERRLRRAIKRLESLKILDVVGVGLSESSIGSLSSNSNGCSGQQAPEMEDPAGSLSTVDSGLGAGGSEDKGWDGGDSVKGSSAGSCTQLNSSQDGSWFSVVSEQSGSGTSKDVESRTDFSDDAKNCGSGDSAAAADVDHDAERREEQAAATSSGSSKSEVSYRDEDDDRLALVLVDNPHYGAEADGDSRATEAKEEEEKEEKKELAMVLAGPQPGATSVGGSDVQSVLLALRQVKEQLRCTIQRRSEGLVAHRELYGH